MRCDGREWMREERETGLDRDLEIALGLLGHWELGHA